MPKFRFCFLFFLIISFIHGAFIIWHYHHDRWPENLYNHPIEIVGTIVNLPHVNQTNAEQFWLKTKEGIIQLNWYYPYPYLKPGEEWQLVVKIKPNHFRNNPGEFDYGNYLKEQGILASGYVMTKRPPTLLGENPWHTPIQSLRFYVFNQVINATHGLAMQGILLALILGDKSLLNAHQWQVFEDSGVSYFMVISGLHIVLFAAMGGLAARYLWCLIPRAPLKIPAQRIGLIVGLSFGMLYSILAGFPVPTQRALWMLWLMGMAKLFLERVPGMHLLFAAFVIVMAWNPLSFNSVAFWLSFVAVFFLIYTMAWRKHKLTHLEEWIYPQWVMYFALMPILLYVFHEFSIISLGTNFIAMPFMMLAVIPLALLGGVMLFIIPPLGKMLFIASNWIMTGLFKILNYSVDFPHVLIHPTEPSLFLVVFSLLGCMILFAPRGVPGRWVGLLMILPLLFPKPLLQEDQIKITNLQIEDGSVTIFETQHHIFIEQNIHHLREAKSAIHHIIEPYLQTHGETSIDVWVINGAKDYHAIQSLENTWQTIQISKIVLPHLPKTFDNTISSCEQPLFMQEDHVNLAILPNNKQCKITVTH